jgi:hypothetical protein
MNLSLFLSFLTFFDPNTNLEPMGPLLEAPQAFQGIMDQLLLCEVPSKATLVETHGSFATDKKTLWTYWDKGLPFLSPFQRLNLCLWRQTLGMDWQVVVMDQNANSPLHYAHFLPPSQLPRSFFHPQFSRLHDEGHLSAVYRSDMLRLPLLERYGGLWADLTTLPLKHPESFCSLEDALCGFVLPHQGLKVFNQRNHFENWFILARAQSPLIQAWSRAFFQFWDDHLSAVNIRKFASHQDLDLSAYWRRANENGTFFDLASYLTMHVVLLERLTHDPLFSMHYLKEAKTFDAWKHSYTYVHVHGKNAWGGKTTQHHLLDALDRKMLASLLKDAWVLKFPSEEARPLQQASIESLKTKASTLSSLYVTLSLQLSKPRH